MGSTSSRAEGWRLYRLQQITQRGHRALVDQLGVALVHRVITAGHSLLQGHHHIRVEGMIFLAVHILEQAALLNGLALRPGLLATVFCPLPVR